MKLRRIRTKFQKIPSNPGTFLRYSSSLQISITPPSTSKFLPQQRLDLSPGRANIMNSDRNLRIVRIDESVSEYSRTLLLKLL